MVTTEASATRAQMAHLLRRAGFGATPDELDRYVSQGYDATVEELLNPGDPQNLPDDILFRYMVDLKDCANVGSSACYWLYRLATTHNPLEEKIALFWHGVLATGYTKLNAGKTLLFQIDMFRRFGMGRLDDLLAELARDPAMIVWLDNNDNHADAINENWGRELLELFSMGIGNYTEDDVKEASRAFTGWTLGNAEYLVARSMKDSIWPYGRIAWTFDYRESDNDAGQKTFLGETGNFNGDDIVEIICKQPATAQFISRHLYDFFVADEVPVSQWAYTPPRDPEAIALLSDAYFENDHHIGAKLRTLF